MPMDIITPPSLLQAGFQWRAKDGVRALGCPPLEAGGFTCGFSTRLGGVSAMPQEDLNLAGFDDDTRENIMENRRRFFELLGGGWHLAAGWQVHGTEVRVARRAPDARCDQDQADAIISQQTNLLLGVKTADCVPILLADAATGAMAAVHAGWRGTLGEIAPKTLRRLAVEFHTKPENVRAAIGPAALGCCYQVGPEVIRAFKDKFSYAGELFSMHYDDHAHIDLHRANRRQLTDAGLREENIYAAPLCTMCRTDLFFSYRREKPRYGKTGRLLAVIGRKNQG
jgi:hypothetical protein